MIYKVGIVGYGTIGKRVADAILLQDDMKLVGITGNSCNYKLHNAQAKGIDIYATNDSTDFKSHGIEIAGDIKELINKVDVIVDATPKKIGFKNKEQYYKKAGVKAIFQGGEKHDIANTSFVAQCNYDEAIDKDFVRVVSCNTTGLSRSLHELDKKYGIQKARATLIRRGGDPADVKKGPINAIIPSFELPSHHGPDVRTILHNMEVFTTAVIVPTTLMHMHNLSVVLDQKTDKEDIINTLEKATRIKMIHENHHIRSTAEIIEYARDIGNKRGDIPETCIWEEGVGIYKDELFFPQAIHQESIVVPENIDAIRAMMGFSESHRSIEKTNKSMGIQ